MDDIELNRTVPLATAVVRAMVPMRDLPAFLTGPETLVVWPIAEDDRVSAESS